MAVEDIFDVSEASSLRHSRNVKACPDNNTLLRV